MAEIPIFLVLSIVKLRSKCNFYVSEKPVVFAFFIQQIFHYWLSIVIVSLRNHIVDIFLSFCFLKFLKNFQNRKKNCEISKNYCQKYTALSDFLSCFRDRPSPFRHHDVTPAWPKWYLPKRFLSVMWRSRDLAFLE